MDIVQSSFLNRVREHFFVYGFAKSKRDNIEKSEEEFFRKAAKELLALTEVQIRQLIEINAMTEVTDENETTI